jgi:N-acetylglucosamine malate deacetylase 1
MKVDILAFGAHPDDVELSAAGTLMKHIDMGYTVAIVDLTEGELGSRGTVQSRYQEAADAGSILGISARTNLKMPDGYFEHSQENLLKIVEQIRHFQPSIVFANAIEDRHPDHAKGSKIVSDACFLAGLSKIETIFNGEKQIAFRPKAVYHYIQDRYIKPDFVVDVSPYVERKIQSIKAYKTQFYSPDSQEPQTPISGPEFFDFLLGRMSQYGRAIQVQYAEGFTVERFIGVQDMLKLV